MYQNVNRNQRRKLFSCDDRVRWRQMPDRSIITNKPDPEVVNNKIQTTHSNFITFIPYNLLGQLAKPVNVYFIIVALFQMIPSITYTERKPMILIPLSMVTFTVMLKDAYEQLSRYLKDRQENNRSVSLLHAGKFDDFASEVILIGDLVRIKKDQLLSCDMVLLQSSDQKRKCYIQTKNLDGQTTLKTKKVPPSKYELQDLNEEELFKEKLQIKYERPTPYLNSFSGHISIHGETLPLSLDNLLLKGSVLKNVDEVIGVAVYTGKQTKLMLNSVKFKPKSSRLEGEINRMVMVIFLMQFGLSIMCGVMNMLTEGRGVKQLRDVHGSSFWITTGSWWLLMTYFVPISLVVTMELVKIFQGAIMSRDKRLYSPMTNSMPIMNNSKVNQNLGQIRYVCSDKTGTLTRNIMNFNKIHAFGEQFGKSKPESKLMRSKLSKISKLSNQQVNKYQKLGITNVSFEDDTFFSRMDQFEQLIIALCLCHQVIIEQSQDRQSVYGSSSPDEIAIINFCKLCKYQYLGEKNGVMTIKDKKNNIRQYKMHALLEFSSERKRMSVIVQYQGEYFLYMKGADSYVKKLALQDDAFLQKTQKGIDQFSKEGLRTLMVARKKIQKQQLKDWLEKYNEANISLVERKKKLEDVYDLIENNLQVIGATGVEDLLQEGVEQAIQMIKECQIIFYILTGDKKQTAINIGRTCGMIPPDTQILIPPTAQPQEITKWLKDRSPLPSNSVLIIDASCPLPSIPLHPTICYRCTPTQKQAIVKSIQSQTDELVLAIGDGSNDINMVSKADFGVGLRGKEGNQVTRVADLVIGQFYLLTPVLLHYGRQWYKKNSKLVNFAFFKNIYHLMALVGYGGWSFFSGSMIFDINMYMFFNVLFTTLPIICYALFDEEYTLQISLQYPKVYCPGPNNQYFNQWTYWKNTLIGTVYGLITTIICYLFLQTTILQQDGRITYFSQVGMVIFLSIILISNFKVQAMGHGFSFVIILSSLLSIASYYILYKLYEMFFVSDIKQSFYTQLASPTIWMIHLIFVMLMIGIDLANKKYFQFESIMKFNEHINHLHHRDEDQFD